MTSLMSIFDPSSLLFMNWWVVGLIPFFPVFSFYWFSSFNKIYLKLTTFLVYSFFPRNNKGLRLIFTSVFFTIFSMNLIGILPFTFSATSHLSFNFTLSFCLWVGITLWGLFYDWEHTMAHLTPMGCPSVLVPFMVVVELISKLIRPLTLSLRLMANIMAGHLILTLIEGGIASGFFIMSKTTITVFLSLLMFETGVGLIQSYIFSYLLYTYWEENDK